MEEKMSLWKMMYGAVWGSPAKTLEHITQRPRFWGAFVLMTVVNLLLTIPLLPKTREAALWAMQSMPGEIKLSAAQIDSYAGIVAYSSIAAAVLLPMLLWLVAAALLKLFNAFTGEKASFKALLAVSIFSYLPVILDGIIKTPLVWAAEVQNMSRITISPAIFLTPPQGLVPGRAYTFLSQFDPFIIWTLIIMALGGSIAMKVSFRKTAAYIASLWMILVLGITFLSRSPGV
ncbi:MAG: YIP1 family protein [Actinobacteria bacterium]|nr:YIP1 family protein [Actinomycetota bacterium]